MERGHDVPNYHRPTKDEAPEKKKKNFFPKEDTEDIGPVYLRPTTTTTTVPFVSLLSPILNSQGCTITYHVLNSRLLKGPER